MSKLLDTNLLTGLTIEQAEQRLKKYGPNKLPTYKKPSIVKIFLKTFLDPLSLIMSLAGLISLTIGLIFEMSVSDIVGLCIIGLIIITNSIISTYQEVKSINFVSSLSGENEVFISCLRDGNVIQINVEDLVPGDLVYTKLGEFVPADLRIIQQTSIKIDESSLTGESEPVEKQVFKIHQDDLIIADQNNIAFKSTLVLEGKMLGIFLRTGEVSEIGKIANLITGHEVQKTALEQKIRSLVVRIGIVSIFFGLIIFCSSYFMNFNKWNTLLLISVSAAISVIPESLTIIVKLCMMIATIKMDKNNVRIKNPKSIETLGNVNVICSDKTGTLTMNKMDIDQYYVNMQSYNANADIDESNIFIKSLILCNDAEIDSEENINASASETAIVKFIQNQNINFGKIKSKFNQLDEIPFNSDRKMMIKVYADKQEMVTYTKGALDYLLPLCTGKIINNKITKLTQNDKNKILDQTINYAKQGLRVMGVCFKQLNNIDEPLEENLIFIGLIAIIDPPRPEAKKAIQMAHNAGIRVIMITGDHKITASEIATRLGIMSDKYNDIITGAEIDHSSEQEIAERIKHTNVFARVNPEHKALIVSVLQEQKNIVAMTGDGVNDTPSIVKADVGIAMGLNGSEVTKEVSDVILKDDNFKSIVFGIKTGRNVYEKLKYSISFLVAANIAQVLTILLVLAIYKELALNSVDILFHIFVVETIVAIPIGMQHDRSGVMSDEPKSSQ